MTRRGLFTFLSGACAGVWGARLTAVALPTLPPPTPVPSPLLPPGTYRFQWQQVGSGSDFECWWLVHKPTDQTGWHWIANPERYGITKQASETHHWVRIEQQSLITRRA